MLTRLISLAGAVALTLTSLSARADDAKRDIKQGVPAEVHMAIYGRHNPERDYQRKFGEEIINTIKEEKIGRRVIELIGSRIPEDKKQHAKDVWQEFKKAAEPFDANAFDDLQEVIYAQRMEGPFNHHLVLMRFSNDHAEGAEQAIVNVFELLSSKEEKIKVEKNDVGGIEVTTLRLPKQSPYHPSVARADDILVLCSEPELMKRSLEQLAEGSGESKFDDPRLKEALKELPEPEDSLVFFDGRQFFKSLAGVAEFIREQKPDDEDATRAARIFDEVIENVAILDYEVAVEYTEDGQNRQAAIGKLVDDAEEKVLGQAVLHQQPFTDWQSWIPADATSYSLCTGVNLHVIYQGIMDLVSSEIPEAEDGLERFERFQDKIGVQLDRDILQNITGECVCVTSPVGEGDSAKSQTVFALRVKEADDVRALITRGVEALQKLPMVQPQQVVIVEDEELEGFQEIKANVFAALGVRPVFGFRDDWLILSSHREAASKVVAVRSGDAESIDGAKTLKQFDIEADGDVYLASYTDVGASVRRAADLVDQIGTWAMVFGGAALANAPEKDAETVREALGLLPSIAKVIRKFDFYEDRLSIVQEGPEDNTYRRDTVTNIRQEQAEQEK
ncbi:MAG: hypothetical protein IT424_07585 [Pirellulales bacterium]|nr:hypothetical protein [Pirellulales bacterium]